jgi:hypothetical protein
MTSVITSYATSLIGKLVRTGARCIARPFAYGRSVQEARSEGIRGVVESFTGPN